MRQELWALIGALRAQGVSILMSTHYIEEAERLADTVEVYGPPDRLAEVEAGAVRDGLRTRRTGTSISLLTLDRATAPLPAGERRPANREDVFVLLTG